MLQFYKEKVIQLKQYCQNKIYKYFEKNNIILDPFCGSGTTCIAAKLMNRKFIGIEIDEVYFNASQKRLALL